MTDIRGPDVGARLDRLPTTWYIWYLVGLVSFGAFFEIYDLVLTAPLSLGLLAAGVFHRGAAGLFGITDQATFAAATFAGLYVGTLTFSTVADRLGRRPVFTFALLWYATATVVMGELTSYSVIFYRAACMAEPAWDGHGWYRLRAAQGNLRKWVENTRS